MSLCIQALLFRLMNCAFTPRGHCFVHSCVLITKRSRKFSDYKYRLFGPERNVSLRIKMDLG